MQESEVDEPNRQYDNGLAAAAAHVSLAARKKLRDGCHFDAALILACLLFAPSSVSWGALSGSLPFAAIIAIVGLGQLLVVQQGGFDLSLAGGVSLAVVISTHYPQGDNALLLPAVLMAIACAILAGLANGILVSLFRLNAIVATIGVNALLYGAVFAVSGGVPKTTTTLLAAIAGGQTARASKHASISRLAALLVVSFVLKKTVAGRRFEAIGANPLAARAVGLRVQLHQLLAYVYAQLLYCMAGVLVAGITREPTAFQGDSPAPAVRRRRCSRRNVAARRSRLSDLHRHRRLLPEPVEPIRTRRRRAVLGSDHHPGLGLGFWYRRLLGPVDGKRGQANQTNSKGRKQ